MSDQTKNTPKKLLAIMAVSDEWGIGNNGRLPWNNKDEMRFFKFMTINHTVVMGRKTFDSMGRKPLPNRRNIVLTNADLSSSTMIKDPNGVEFVNSIDDASFTNKEEVYVIGGISIIKMLIDRVEAFLVSTVEGEYECDTFLSEELLTDRFEFKVRTGEGDGFVVDTYSHKEL